MLVWIDLEMTGLDPEKDVILEVGCIVTDFELNELESYHAIVSHVTLPPMDDWCTRTHTESGLLKQVKASQISLSEAESNLVMLLSKYKGTKYLAGNTVYMDRIFLRKYMPELNSQLHYRIVDVSSIKVLVNAWYDDIEHKKKLLHRSIDDIRESIDELRYYRIKAFVRGDGK